MSSASQCGDMYEAENGTQRNAIHSLRHSVCVMCLNKVLEGVRQLELNCNIYIPPDNRGAMAKICQDSNVHIVGVALLSHPHYRVVVHTYMYMSPARLH